MVLGRISRIFAAQPGHPGSTRCPPALAFGLYLVLTLALTWPLLPGLARQLPSDLGDPVLNSWILHWDVTHLLRLLSGDGAALQGFWNANIFYPSPLALAYSEHLLAQAVQVLPVYALTGNIVLCYNLLFLSTFVLSALGVYLLVRSLTGNEWAAFLAGLLFAFAPYRIAQFPHLQVLSTQWMAFALFGLHRFFETGRTRALAGGAAALLAQNLSCGYFLLYFSPFAAAFVAWEVVRRGLLRDWRLLAKLLAAGVAVAACTLPFLLPYLELRELGINAREVAEVRLFSANLLAYLTSTPWIHGWGRLAMVFRAPEGELFPGFVLLAVIVWGACRASRGPALPAWRTMLAVVLGVWAAVQVVLVLHLLTGGGPRLNLGPVVVSLKDFQRTTVLALVALAAFFLATPKARGAAARLFRADWAFWTVAALAAAVLSLGPVIAAGVRELGNGPYLLLYRYVPGFDGVRVPARLGLVTALMLSVLAGLALDRVLSDRKTGGGEATGPANRRTRPALLVGTLVALFVTEAVPAPILISGSNDARGLKAPSPVKQGGDVPGVYQYLRSMPTREPLVEFPFGDESHEVQYVYYTTEHGHPIVNGYSGLFPPRYWDQREAFGHGRAWKRPWETLLASGAALLVLHEGAYLDAREGARLHAWLLRQGADPVARFGSDTLFRLPR